MHDAAEDFRLHVLATLGYAPDSIEPGKLHRFPTLARRSDDSGWCRLFEDGRGGVFGCFRQQVSDSWCAVRRERMNPAERSMWIRQLAEHHKAREVEQRAEWARAEGYIAHLWAESRSVVAGDPVYRYLCGRMAIDRLDIPAAIRFQPALTYTHDGQRAGTFPGMVAAFTDPGGKLVCLHRTYLTDDGQKAHVPGKQKKMTKACGRLSGGSVRLYGAINGRLGIAEGLETALAAYLGSGVPTVAAYSAGALAAFSWPEGLKELVVFADADHAGRESAQRLRVRAATAGLASRVLEPDTEGADWADIWAAREVTA